MSQQKGISVELLNYRKSKGSLPDLLAQMKPATAMSPSKGNGESIAISDNEEDSSSKIMPKNVNHFDEEAKNLETNTVDPPNKQYIESLGQYSAENQEGETYRPKFPEESKEETVQEGFTGREDTNLDKYKKRVQKITPKKNEPNFSFYSSINQKGDENDGEDVGDNDLGLEEAKEFKE